MAENRSTHWTDDDELLSKFVLHRLQAGEENVLTSHLRACEKCRRAVQEETAILAGAKLAGRAALKDRLKLRLSESEQRAAASVMRKSFRYQMPWTHVASVAAVVTVIVVVGVYNNWFSANDLGKTRAPGQPAQEKGTSQLPATGGIREQSSEFPLKDELAGRVGSGEKDRMNGPKMNRAQPLRENRSEDKRLAEEQFAAPLPAEPTGNTGAGVATLEKSKAAESETLLMDQVAGSQAQAFWVEAHVIPGGSKKDRGEFPASERDRLANVMRHRTDARPDSGQVSKSGSTTISMITLSQRPSSSLPPPLQYGQSQPGAIQTYIENNANAIHLTLYLDSPVAESELRSANVEMIDPDSVILHLASRRIGLRLPPALQGQGKAKTDQGR